MDATLNATVKLLAFADSTISSNPRLRLFDWTRDVSGISVQDPKSESHRIDAGASKTIFDGLRTILADGTTEWDVSLLPIDSGSRYRFVQNQWPAGAGTDPVLRTYRNVDLRGSVDLTLTVNANQTLTIQATDNLAGNYFFDDVVAGDHVFIPHTTTGDAASQFNVLNTGYWQVLSVTLPAPATYAEMVLMRMSGEPFSATTETLTNVNIELPEFLVYSSNGVQIGDIVDITAGFATATRRTFEVVAVTSQFFEVISSAPLPSEAGIIPGANGLKFYSEAKSFLYIEASQITSIRCNGNALDTDRIEPTDPSDPTKPGIYMKRGPTFALVLVNRSDTPCDVTVIHAE